MREVQGVERGHSFLLTPPEGGRYFLPCCRSGFVDSRRPMMRRIAGGMGTLLSLLMLAAPCRADVIGSRSGGSATRNRAAVERQLQGLGVHPQQARREAAELSARDVAYFAADPGRIVLAGAAQDRKGDMFSGDTSARWYEIVGGVLLAGIVIGVIVFAATQARK